MAEGRTDGNIYGAGPYHQESDPATAAVHAGLLKPGEKGILKVTVVEHDSNRFEGSEKNGVKTKGQENASTRWDAMAGRQVIRAIKLERIPVE